MTGFSTPPSYWLSDVKRSASLLEAYLNHGIFSGAMWDPSAQRRRGIGARDVIDVEDLFGPTLLSAPIRRSAGKEILERSASITGHLRAIPIDLTLWYADAAIVDEGLRHARALMNELQSIPYIASTRASKLVAAKRPDLVPIWDREVSRALGAPRKMPWVEYWAAWRQALDTELVAKTRQIAAATSHPCLSPLRVMDIVVWMDKKGWESLPEGAMWAALRASHESN